MPSRPRIAGREHRVYALICSLPFSGAARADYVSLHVPATAQTERLVDAAFYSAESVADLARLAAKNVAEVHAGRRPASIVNPSVLV